MKKTLLTTLATVAVLTAPMSSMAKEDSFYLKANIGIGMNLDSDVDNISRTAESAKITYDAGFTGSLAAGYDFANPLRMELELIRQKSDMEVFSSNNAFGSPNEGDLKKHALMLNAFYDVDTGSAWTPFVGAGMGWSRIDVDAPGFNGSDNEDDVFAYQLIGGVAYAINEQWSVDAQYRFRGTSDATIDGADFDVNSNDVMVGLRFNF